MRFAVQTLPMGPSVLCSDASGHTFLVALQAALILMCKADASTIMRSVPMRTVT